MPKNTVNGDKLVTDSKLTNRIRFFLLVTWEAEENIPHHLIEEFLSGAHPAACDTKMHSGVGGVMYTLTVQQHSKENYQRPVLKDNDR